MSLSFVFWPRFLPFQPSRGILKLPREDGRKRTRLAPIPIGGSWLRFLSFHMGRRRGRGNVPSPADLLSNTGYGVGKVPVALFSVIALALFSVIASFAQVAQWPCFRLSSGPLFDYHIQALLIVQPDTLLRWHRDLFRLVWRRKSKRKGKVGREPLAEDTIHLIKTMARANQAWGAERIRGELLKLGIKVAKSTIQRYINQVRGPLSTKQTWSTFLRNHTKDIWAVDFLQTCDLFFRAIFVFVVIELGSRRILHFGVTRSPNDAWVAQQLREATPFGQGPRLLIRDNDKKFGDAFDRVAEGTDIEVLTTPFQAPKANAICERFLGSLRRECLDFFLILNERHLRRTLHQLYLITENKATSLTSR